MSELPLPHGLSPSRVAIFLDFDGTLAPIVADPARASVPPETVSLLRRLQVRTEGAIAVVSGRSIDQLDRMLYPLELALAGVHGAERRDVEGNVTRSLYDHEQEMLVVERVNAFVDAHQGLLAEIKPGSVALHYRKRPKLEQVCREFARNIAEAAPSVSLVPGKMVIEMTLAGRTKGNAIADFMQELPFLNRLPVFAGDDVTDEAGFAVVNAVDGIAIKIGAGETSARYRIESPAALADWLQGLAQYR